MRTQKGLVQGRLEASLLRKKTDDMLTRYDALLAVLRSLYWLEALRASLIRGNIPALFAKPLTFGSGFLSMTSFGVGSSCQCGRFPLGTEHRRNGVPLQSSALP